MISQDIIIIGGGVSGSLMALSLIKRSPKLKITIIEKSHQFHKKVGESTSDLTALYFKSEGLQHILDKQLPKTGLRFWFTPDLKNSTLQIQNEYSSPSFKSIINGYQFNRASLDQDLLDECLGYGIKILRPAKVKKISYHPYNNELEIFDLSTQQIIQMKSIWTIDCSGRDRIVSRDLDWGHEDQLHTTASTWAHYQGLKPMEKWDTLSHPILDQQTLFPRYHVTGHFMRKGLWWWHIPLNDNTISLGVVYDKKIHNSSSLNARELFQELIDTDPRLKELTKEATFEKLYHYPHLPYLPTKLYNQGTLVIGDAAGFIDPLFSPGIEMTCQQIAALTPILLNYFDHKKNFEKLFTKYEKNFLQSYRDRMFTYQNKYQVFGSYDLFSCWTQMDLVGYYFFHSIPSAFYSSWIKRPVIIYKPLKIIYNFFKNRFLIIERNRQHRRSNSNHHEHSLTSPITFSGARVPSSPRVLLVALIMLIKWIKFYSKIELNEFIEKISTKSLPQKLMDLK